MSSRAPYPTHYDPRDWVTARELVDSGLAPSVEAVYTRAKREGWRRLPGKPTMYFVKDIAKKSDLFHSPYRGLRLDKALAVRYISSVGHVRPRRSTFLLHTRSRKGPLHDRNYSAYAAPVKAEARRARPPLT